MNEPPDDRALMVRDEPPLEVAPPNNGEAEATVLASILINEDAAVKVAAAGLQPEDFFQDRHQRIYAAMVALRARREVVNYETVAHELTARHEVEDIGGLSYLKRITAELPTSIGVQYSAANIRKDATFRRLIDAAGKMARLGFAGGHDADGALDQAQALLRKIARPTPPRTMRDVAEDLMAEVVDLSDGGAGIGVYAGLPSLHTSIGGWRRGELVVLAAGTSQGKSGFATYATWEALQRDESVLFLSVEMPDSDVLKRLAQISTGINPKVFEMQGQGGFEQAEALDAAQGQFTNEAIRIATKLPLVIRYFPRGTMEELRSAMEEAAHGAQPPRLVIVDHIHRIPNPPGERNRVQGLDAITSELAALAGEFNTAVLAPAQMNRESKRENRPPELHDLRDSGAIEQNAGVVLFLYWPKQEGAHGGWYQPEHTIDDRRWRDMSLIVAKNRNGATLTIPVLYDPTTQRFMETPADLLPPEEDE